MSGFGIEHHCLNGQISGMLNPVRFLNVTLIHTISISISISISCTEHSIPNDDLTSKSSKWNRKKEEGKTAISPEAIVEDTKSRAEQKIRKQREESVVMAKCLQ